MTMETNYEETYFSEWSPVDQKEEKDEKGF